MDSRPCWQKISSSITLFDFKWTPYSSQIKFEFLGKHGEKNLVNHLTTKKEIKESKDSTLIPNETLLNAVLANNFNVLYSNTLSESQKEELKNILSIPYEDLLTKTSELKESINNQVSTLLSESNETDLINKLKAVKDEVNQMFPSRYNYYRLNELKNGLN